VSLQTSAPETLRGFAEQPGRYLTWDHDGTIALHVSSRMRVVVAPTWGVVTSIDTTEDELTSLLDEVRELIPAGVHTDWYLGPSARPAGVADKLMALGLRAPADGSGTLDALLLDHEPTGVPSDVETREVATMSDFTDAAELRMEAFGLSEEVREHERGFLATYYDEHLRMKGRSTISFVATVDGRVAGAATALLSDHGLFLIGGATAPWARRRGVYRALVGARWRYAADRGTPALTVHARPDTSSPVLRRMGFREVCSIRHLEGRPT
jgi:GNAT superfamily N-acetyltransferase